MRRVLKAKGMRLFLPITVAWRTHGCPFKIIIIIYTISKPLLSRSTSITKNRGFESGRRRSSGGRKEGRKEAGAE